MVDLRINREAAERAIGRVVVADDEQRSALGELLLQPFRPLEEAGEIAIVTSNIVAGEFLSGPADEDDRPLQIERHRAGECGDCIGDALAARFPALLKPSPLNQRTDVTLHHAG